ncbi:MAG: hypothetical protein K2Y21_12140 [Phycisphaerales bacterium]|nr:hypothetical protein [Phycisphaerales bacterium]
MRTRSTVVVVAAAASALSGLAFAGVVVTSRTSTISESKNNLFFPAPSDYNNTDGTTALGAWTGTLPQGYTHTSTASNSFIGGVFRGSSSLVVVLGEETKTSAKLESNFTVSGSTTARVSLNGFSTPSQTKGATPQSLSAYLAIFNADTNAVVFDSFDHASLFIDPVNARDSLRWNGFSLDLNLSAGNYRVLIGADITKTSNFGGTSNSFSGLAELDASVAFIPAPGAGLLLGGVSWFAARRRRAA